MDKEHLIIALDTDAPRAGAVFMRLKRELGLSWFKVGTDMLLQHSGMTFIENMLEDGCNLFLDCKLYGSPSYIRRAVQIACTLNASFITVKGDIRTIETAMNAKFGISKIIAVPTLTNDDGMDTRHYTSILEYPDGFVLSAQYAHFLNPVKKDKIFICPGIRFPHQKSHDHSKDHVSTPTAAFASGADYIVVGRPIVCADDPVKTVRMLLDEP